MTGQSDFDENELIDFVRSALIQSIENNTRRKRTLTSSFSGVASVGAAFTGQSNDSNVLGDVLEEELESLQVKIEQQISSFNRKHNETRGFFESIAKQVQELNEKRDELLQRIEQQNANIEQHTQLEIAQVRSFRMCASENDAFLNELIEPKNQLLILHELLNSAVKADHEHRYETLLQLLNEFEPKASLLELHLKENVKKSEAYTPIVNRMLNVLRQMQTDKTNLHEKLEYDLRQLWLNSFKVRKEQLGRELQFNCVGRLSECVQQPDEYMNALQKLDLLQKYVEKFGQHLIDTVITTVLENTDQQLSQDLQVNEKSVHLKLSFNVHSFVDCKEQVLLCLSNILRFLSVAFANHTQAVDFLCPTVQQMFELLDKRLLNSLRPSVESELTNYSRLLDQSEQLQQEALQLGLLQSKHLRDFSLDMHADVGNKRCNEILLKARRLIKTDLFPTQLVGQDLNAFNLTSDLSDYELKQKFVQNQNLFAFPQCQVSESIVKLNDLLNEIAIEMRSSSSSFRFDLYRTARNVLEMYLDISPIQHESMLSKSHQPAAVFHNNCFYLAHHVQLLTIKTIAPDSISDRVSVLDVEEPDQHETIEKNEEDVDKASFIKEEHTKIKDEDEVEENESVGNMWNDDEDEDINVKLEETASLLSIEKQIEKDFQKQNQNQDEEFDEWKDDLESSNINLSTLSIDSQMEKQSEDFVVCFVDFVPVLRDQGTEQLLAKLREYRELVLNILNEARFGFALQETGSVASEHQVELQTCLKRCIYQIWTIQERWKPILPVPVTYRASGLLIDALLEKLLSRIISIEDISSKGCDMLADCLLDLLSKTNELFENQKAEQYARLWKKTKELHFVLKAKLTEIVDRWAEGCGPLALVFSAEELKSLIRALFQNTQTRADALSKIRNV